jgi:hypothetical protein
MADIAAEHSQGWSRINVKDLLHLEVLLSGGMGVDSLAVRDIVSDMRQSRYVEK